jgi:triosephosphate isomerase
MFYCAGNWKMNMTVPEAKTFVEKLRQTATDDEQERLILLPPALLALTVAEALQDSAIAWGGQNSYFETQGAFTGENSPHLLKLLGARYCLVGHSERRHIFGEPDEMLAKKVKALQEQQVTPILCVGETRDDRRWNRTQEVIVRQLRGGLQLADSNKPFWLAYEPVWAIGTGEVATPEQVEEAHLILRKGLRDWSASATERVPILYGGSVKPDNAQSLAALANVNGFLIGGASLKVDDFVKILRQSVSK